MGKYVARRLLQAIPLLFFISVMLFVIMNNLGDPAATLLNQDRPPTAEERARVERMLGLDKPVYIQYIFWLIGNDWTLVDPDGDGESDTPGNRRGILRGDLGRSLVTGQPALERIQERLPNTLLLMVPMYLLVLVISLGLGVYSALRQYSLLDNILTSVAFVFYSMPIFFIALAMIYIFAVNFRKWGLPYLPIAGMFDAREPQTALNLIRHMILPVLSLALIQAAGYIRFIRASMLEALSQDYVRTAYAKGLHERRVIFLHALKNAALPLITLVGLSLPGLLGGAVVTESIFAWPGMGLLFIDSLNRGDYAVLMGLLMLISVAVVLFQLLTDIAYTWFDPRVKLS